MSHTKFSAKSITDKNGKIDTMKLLEENIGVLPITFV